MKTICAVMISLLAVNVFAGWGEWTSGQQDSVSVLVKASPSKDIVVIRDELNERPVVSVSVTTNTVPRDPSTIKAERIAKAVGQSAGIVRTDTDAEMDSKLQSWIVAGATDADKIVRSYRAGAFVGAYLVIQTLEGSGDDTRNVVTKTPVLGNSPLMGLGIASPATCNDVKAALRAQP